LNLKNSATFVEPASRERSEQSWSASVGEEGEEGEEEELASNRRSGLSMATQKPSLVDPKDSLRYVQIKGHSEIRSFFALIQRLSEECESKHLISFKDNMFAKTEGDKTRRFGEREKTTVN
jgi:hypothetical protein